MYSPDLSAPKAPRHCLWRFALVFILTTAWASPQAFGQDALTKGIPEKIDQIGKTIDFIDRVISTAVGDDDALIGARNKLLDQGATLNSVMAPVSARLNILNESISKIAPTLESGVAEDAIITNERQQLNNERSELLVFQARKDQLKARITREIERISALRRQAFTSTITKRSPIKLKQFENLISDGNQVIVLATTTISKWFKLLLTSEVEKLALAAALALLLACLFKWFTRNVIQREVFEAPTRFQLLTNALTSTLVPSIVLAIAITVFVVVLTLFGLYPTTVQTVVNPVLFAAVSYFFITALISNILPPQNAGMRLVPLSRYAASKISILIHILVATQVLDYIVSSLASAVNAPLTITIANSFIAALLIGVTLMGVLLVRQDKGAKQRALPRWLRFPTLLVSVAIIGAAFAGYVGLSRFVAQQIVISGAILVTMYLALTASRELGEPGGFGSTRIARWLAKSEEGHSDKLDQYGLICSLLLMALTFLIGIPSLALQWGSRLDDVWTFTKQLFSGINIGSFNFSLGNILLGILIFGLIYFVTRLFQRWLSRAVLSRTSADIGVQNSITTGVGYAGIAIAFLMGITAAGFNLASLAIVAGALSLGIGFGLQNVVSNFVSGLILLVERPIKVGDFIETSTHQGTIKKISVRATELETIHRMSVIVPNSELINSSVGNWTHKIKSGRIDLPIGVAYGTDYKHVREILLECTTHHPEIMKEPRPFVYFVGFGESSVDFQLRVHLRDWTLNPHVQSELLFDICEAFAKNNIEIPFPQRDINIRTIDKDALSALAQNYDGASQKKSSPQTRSPAKSPKSRSSIVKKRGGDPL